MIHTTKPNGKKRERHKRIRHLCKIDFSGGGCEHGRHGGKLIGRGPRAFSTRTAKGTAMALDPKRWAALFVVLSAAFLAVLDFFIVNISIPAIRLSLGASFAQVELVIATYGLAYSIGLITGGRLGDIYGRKRAFLVGMSCFSAASLLCGVAPNVESLIVARALQGLAASVMFPQVLSILRVTFPPEERGRAFGFYGTALGLASITGPLVGGLLLRLNCFGLSWRPIFLVNMPVGLWALWAARRLLIESRAPKPLRPDYLGVAMLSSGLLCLLLPLVLGREQGWPQWTWVSLAAAIPVLGGFLVFQYWKEKRGDSPLLELSLFGYRAFRIGLLITLTLFSGLSAFFLTLALFLQAGLGMGALRAGLMFAPFAIGFVISSNLSGRLLARFGRRVLQAGAAIMSVGLMGLMGLIAWKGVALGVWAIVPALFVYGFGQGFVVAPSISLILGGIPGGIAGSASGVLATFQQAALAFGVALIGGYFFSRLGAVSTPEEFVSAFPVTLRLNLVTLVLGFILVFRLPRIIDTSANEFIVEI